MFIYKLSTRLRCGKLQRNQLFARSLSVAVSSLQKPLEQVEEANEAYRVDDEWMKAKDYESIPGPSRIGMLADFMPGGELYNANLIDLYKTMRGRYGDVYRLKGLMGAPDIVFTYNAKDIELTYRNEGVWPIRIGLESFTYYRKQKRPDIFQGIGGLVSEQGKAWGDIRNKVNPILMKTEVVRQQMPQINEIAREFLIKLESLRDPNTNILKSPLLDELKMWGFESICSVALNTRLGLLTNDPEPNARKLADNMFDFFQYSFEFDVVPSIWKILETPRFKRFLACYDNITNITTNYIDLAVKRFETDGKEEAISVLEKLYRIDKKIAVVMAIDMLMAGIDTTTSTFVTMLYQLAKHPEKQEILRREFESILPTPDSPLTQQNSKNMPYMRACMKESLRITPITPGNLRMAGKDLVLSGYKVPKGTGVLMGVMALANSDTYFPRSAEFLPERWLKSGESACPAAKATNPFVYLPFGFGPRTCIGKRIAEMEIETLMSQLIRKYRVSWQDEKDLQYISNIILVPKDTRAFKFEPLQ